MKILEKISRPLSAPGYVVLFVEASSASWMTVRIVTAYLQNVQEVAAIPLKSRLPMGSKLNSTLSH